jgi:8-oxo-dGTP pyrophosphatase MutT (NUDIX family)
MEQPIPLKFCPRCGSLGYQFRDQKYWYCPVCLFTYFHNVAASASVILEFSGAVLTLERGRNPGKGLLCLPGGFVDAGESAEAAACRECREETGLLVDRLAYVGSWPNDYSYRDVAYHTCDLYFGARCDGGLDSIRLDPAEATGYWLLTAAETLEAPFAFESHRRAVLAWFDGQNR